MSLVRTAATNQHSYTLQSIESVQSGQALLPYASVTPGDGLAAVCISPVLYAGLLSLADHDDDVDDDGAADGDDDVTMDDSSGDALTVAVQSSNHHTAAGCFVQAVLLRSLHMQEQPEPLAGAILSVLAQSRSTVAASLLRYVQRLYALTETETKTDVSAAIAADAGTKHVADCCENVFTALDPAKLRNNSAASNSMLKQMHLAAANMPAWQVAAQALTPSLQATPSASASTALTTKKSHDKHSKAQAAILCDPACRDVIRSALLEAIARAPAAQLPLLAVQLCAHMALQRQQSQHKHGDPTQPDAAAVTLAHTVEALALEALQAVLLRLCSVNNDHTNSGDASILQHTANTSKALVSALNTVFTSGVMRSLVATERGKLQQSGNLLERAASMLRAVAESAPSAVSGSAAVQAWLQNLCASVSSIAQVASSATESDAAPHQIEGQFLVSMLIVRSMLTVHPFGIYS